MRKLSILSLVFLSMLITGAAHGKVCFLADPECQGGLAEKKTLEFEVVKCKKDYPNSINGKDKCLAKDYKAVCKDSTGDYYEEIACKKGYIDIRKDGYGCKDLKCDHCCLPKDIECPGGYELYTHREFLEDGPDECKCGYKPYDTTAGKKLSGGVDGQDAYCAPKIECLTCCDTSKGQYDTQTDCEKAISNAVCGLKDGCYQVTSCKSGYGLNNNKCEFINYTCEDVGYHTYSIKGKSCAVVEITLPNGYMEQCYECTGGNTGGGNTGSGNTGGGSGSGNCLHECDGAYNECLQGNVSASQCSADYADCYSRCSN
jgi:hypothetical protein